MYWTEKCLRIAAICQAIMACTVDCMAINTAEKIEENMTDEIFYNFLRYPCDSPFNFTNALSQLNIFKKGLEENIQCFRISRDVHYIKTCPDGSRIIKKLEEKKMISIFSNQFQKYAIFIHNVIKSIPDWDDRKRCYKNLLDNMKAVICEFFYQKKFVGKLKGYNTKCIPKIWDMTISNAFSQQFVQSFEYFIYKSSEILDRIDYYDEDSI
ncbi:unnamed protein product [Phyllotreta striolata]|uniref:Uncharacterized protein n=1 Tax=Phyllotreta striolata TaxID=444603 RepID=A0A9P0DUZ8_PHYSR|nr:unnamed protein product [Phyllotreta striolata]